jgi:hypothetical protein
LTLIQPPLPPPSSGRLLRSFMFPPKELIDDDKKIKISIAKYARIAAKEQQVLNYLLSSLSHEILLHAATYDTL